MAEADDEFITVTFQVAVSSDGESSICDASGLDEGYTAMAYLIENGGAADAMAAYTVSLKVPRPRALSIEIEAPPLEGEPITATVAPEAA